MHNLTLKLALGAAVIASAPAANAAGLDYFLEIDGVKGESSAHATVEQWQWLRAVAADGSFNGLAMSQAGGVHVASGDLDGDGAWAQLVLSVKGTVPGAQPFMTYAMEDVRISANSAPAVGSATGWRADQIPQNHAEWIIVESFSSATMTYAPLLASGGRGNPIEGRWDTASGRFTGNLAVLGAFDELQAVRWADGTLVISSAVPEPAHWALMALGLAAVGTRLRRQQLAA